MELNKRISGNQDKSISLIRKKKKKNIIHEIYLYDRTLIKRFIRIAPLPDTRRVWQMEDAALRRLSGLPVPGTYGFKKQQYHGKTEILYAREFIEGDPIEFFSETDMVPLAWLMAKFHERGVITRDPSLENFIKTGEGKILFIDFGRSLILNPKNPVMLYYQGKELARLRCHALSGNANLYHRFHEKYFEFLSHRPVRRFLLEQISSGWYKRFVRKHTGMVMSTKTQ